MDLRLTQIPITIHQTLSFENSTRVIKDSLESRDGSYTGVIT